MYDILSLEALLAFLTLASLEIILGIDNIVLIVVITGRLQAQARSLARRLGIGLAMLTRIGLLFSISWVMRLTEPLLSVPGLEHAVTGKDIIMLGGGLFLLAKATLEIHDKTTPPKPEQESTLAAAATSVLGAAAQIAVLDIVFSLDSVITAVGMSRSLGVMVAAIMAAVLVMLFFSDVVGEFVHRHPTIQMLAFAFLLLVGVFLMAEGLGKHIDRGYIYFAMFFSLFVEAMNLRMRGVGRA